MNTTEQALPSAAEKENELIVRAFKDNDVLLQLMRALFYGMKTTPKERALIKSTFASTELREVIRKRFLPRIDRKAPIGEAADVWLGVEQMVFGYSRDTIAQAMQYKARGVEMAEQALALLENPDGKAPSLDFTIDTEADPLAIELLARNQFMRLVETQLTNLKIVAAAQSTASPEDKGKDSSK